MLISKFSDGKTKLEPGVPGVKIGGAFARAQWGMIYWYMWTDHTFDIRVMRKLLGLPETMGVDTNFKMCTADRAKEILCGLRDAVGDQDFEELMAKHDAHLEANND